MKSRFFTVAAMSLLLAVSSFAADNVSGKWAAEMQGPQGAVTTTFTLKVEGDKLTGSVSGRGGETPIAEGTVKGDEVSFNVTRTMNGNEMKMAYKGKVTGDELKLTRTMQGGDRPPQDITAKRVK